MSKQTINIGASPNDGTGTPLRTSFDYTNQNFTELYNALGGGVGLPGSTNQIIFNNGSSLAGNANLLWNSTLNLLTVTGSANITADLTVDGGTLKVDSTNNFVGINKTPTVALDVSGSATITGDLTVRTTGLVVNATGVGVNITPSVRLHASDSDNPANGTLRLGSAAIYGQIKNSASSTGKLEFTSVGTGVNGGYNFSIEAQIAHRIEASGVFSWFDGAGGTRMALNASGLGLGTATFGTSAAKVLAIGTGTEPTTGPAGTVQLFTSIRSASNTIPAIFTEGSGITNAAITNTTVTNKIAIKVNGTIYYLLATTSAA